MKKNDTAGVAIIISIIFVSALMLVTADLTQVILAGIRTRANWLASDRAYYLKESVEEVSAFYSAVHGLGANFDSETAYAAGAGDPDFVAYVKPLMDLAEEVTGNPARGIAGIDCSQDTDPVAAGVQPCVGFSILGRSAADAKFTFGSDTSPLHYSVPLAYEAGGVIKGTGSAAAECVDAENADDPCHWNKIGLGEAVEIPLYYEEDTDSDGVLEKIKPSFSANDSFVLRVRAPCGEFDSNGMCTENVELFPLTTDTMGNPPNFRNIDRDPVLIQWMIVDEGGDDTLIAADKKDDDDKSLRSSDVVTKNTELSAGRINDAADTFAPINNFGVLKNDYYGTDLLAAGSTHPRVTVGNFVSRISKPILRLTLVERPKKADCRTDPSNNYNAFINDTSCDIPYLEYQLLTKDQVSDAKSALTGYAVVGDFRKEFKAYRNRAPSLGGFAMESF